MATTMHDLWHLAGDAADLPELPAPATIQPADYANCNDDSVLDNLTPPGSSNCGSTDYTMKKMEITFVMGMAAISNANRARLFP
jgi:hypothetical protein